MQAELSDLSDYTHDKLGQHQFRIENLGERLQIISNATAKMNERWMRGDDATRSFIATWFRVQKDNMDTFFPTISCFSPH
ncbi:hypothetical protein Bca4012_063140 [Brassica carinata]